MLVVGITNARKSYFPPAAKANKPSPKPTNPPAPPQIGNCAQTQVIS